MKILKTWQQLEVATEKGSWKQMFLKYREILKDYKSNRNPLKMLKTHFFGNVEGPQSVNLSKKKLHYKYFSINFSNF